MEFNGLPRKNTFKRFLIKEVNEKGIVSARLIELADYEEFLNAGPAIMPEAEIKVRSDEQLRDVLAHSPELRGILAENAANAGGIPKEEALKQIEAMAFWDKPKKGFFERFLGLFK